jgi:hypothetical protein
MEFQHLAALTDDAYNDADAIQFGMSCLIDETLGGLQRLRALP